jgi:peroxiredoxin
MKANCFLFILFVISVNNPLFAQKKGHQKINIEILDTTLKSDKLYLSRLGEDVIDSATVINKKAQFTIKKNNYPRYFLESSEHQKYFSSFVSDFKKDISIKIYSFKKYDTDIDAGELDTVWKKCNKEIMKGFNDKKRNTRYLRGDSLVLMNQFYDSLLYVSFKTYFSKSSFLGLSLLHSHKQTLHLLEPDITTLLKLKALLSNLDNGLSNHKFTKELNTFFDDNSKLQVGKSILDFTLPSQNGTTISTQSYRGKFLLIDFWATWCAPCILKNKKMANDYDKMKEQNIEILGINIDFEKQEFKDSLINKSQNIFNAYKWQQGMLFQNSEKSKIEKFYKVYFIPRTVLIDKDGIILGVNIDNYEDIIAIIKKNKS